MKGESSNWRRLNSKEVYRNPWIWLTEDKVVTPIGRKLTFGVVHKKHFPLIIPWDGKYLTLIQQYRYMVNGLSWEFPQGHVGNKTMLVAAKAELLEEAGLRAKQIKLLESFWINPGLTDQICFVYIASGLVQAKLNPDPGEDIRATKRVTILKLKEMIAGGLIKDGVTIAAFNLFNICFKALTPA